MQINGGGGRQLRVRGCRTQLPFVTAALVEALQVKVRVGSLSRRRAGSIVAPFVFGPIVRAGGGLGVELVV